MMDLEEALSRILAAIPTAQTEAVALNVAHRRILNQNVFSPIDLPPFDNSAMDGYAVRAGDVANARPDAPVRLTLIGRVAAGETFHLALTANTCVRLFTGSPLPQGADAIVMQEDTRTEPEVPGQIAFLESVKPWENVRFRGEDIKQGARIAERGKPLTAGTLSLFSAVGLVEVNVGRPPVVGLLSTGSELVEPGRPLLPGRIYESNRVGLCALLQQVHCVPRVFPIVADQPAAVRAAMERALAECDAVLTSGGVSVGEMDFIKSSFEAAGGALEFWRVAVKPGRPFAFGRYKEKFLFGLPGNPVSALVTFLLLVRPALLRWQGATEVSLSRHRAILAEPLTNPGPRRHFMRVKVDAEGNVFSAGIQASHVLSSLGSANGLVDVPAGTELQTGAPVQVLRWED